MKESKSKRVLSGVGCVALSLVCAVLAVTVFGGTAGMAPSLAAAIALPVAWIASHHQQ